MENSKNEVEQILDDHFNLNEVNNTALWLLEERMGADHFATHATPGIHAGHMILTPITKEEIEKMSKDYCIDCNVEVKDRMFDKKGNGPYCRECYEP